MANGWGGGREGLVESASANSPTTRERNTERQGKSGS